MTKNSHNLPFSPSRWPFFYGWFILFAAAVGTVSSVPGQTFGVSAFTEPLLKALAIDRTHLSLAYLVGTIGSALLLTWGGKAYDAVGARVSALIASAGMGCSLLYLSTIDRITETLTGALGADHRAWIGFAAIACGFMVLRFCGQGMLTMVSRNMLMKWFDHKRGLASGIMGTVVALTFSSTPFFFDRMIEHLGWKNSWLLMGIVALSGICLFITVFFRDNPEACGLQPDGGREPKPDDPRHDPDHDYTLAQARRTPQFWVFNLTIALHALYFTAFTFHVVSVFDQAGIGKTKAFAVFVPASVLAVGARIFCGWLSDHVRLVGLLLVLMSGMAVSMLGLVLLSTGVGYYMIIIGNGAAGAVFGLLASITWPRFFGRTHLGAISGFHMAWTVAFSAFGPFAFGLSLEHLDSYLTAVVGCLALLAVLFLCSLKWCMSGPEVSGTA